jgi:SAM-dependent methyltransferase
VLRAKPGSSLLAIVIGDMTDLPCADASLGLVFAAFNTLFNLTSARAQQTCFREAARVLEPEGRLVVEGFVPDPDAMPTRATAVRDTTPDRVTVITTRHERSAQLINGEHVEVTPGEVTRRPWMIRYATPGELDEMARSAGLALESRASSWEGDPFATSSGSHVTVYRRRTETGETRG